MPDYEWKPIEPLAQRDREIDLAATRPLYETWRRARKRLAASSPASLQRFNDRVVRRLSVETGILERLYHLDRTTAEALVKNGFAEDLISETSTDMQPSRLIDILRDHEAAMQLAIDYATKKRLLTKGIIHEVHDTLTRHQETAAGVDRFGRRVGIPLRKGAYKERPNNPRRPDGFVHEYCPPLQVDTEMEKLLGWLATYGDDDPVIVAAWLHHRFTQIHPYQDGNGRVARVLTALVLLRADLPPLVVDRGLRTEYIKALESADAGDLKTLALLFARLERRSIVEGLSVDPDADDGRDMRFTSSIIQSLAVKLGNRKAEKDSELRRVNDVAKILRKKARHAIQVALYELKQTVSVIARPEIYIADGGPERENAHHFKYEVVKVARETRTWVNFRETHYFVKANFRVAEDRLTFVTSFHHIGRQLAGVMEASAFARLDIFPHTDGPEKVPPDFVPCSPEPFVFTYQHDAEEMAPEFGRWMDTALGTAIKAFGDRI